MLHFKKAKNILRYLSFAVVRGLIGRTLIIISASPECLLRTGWDGRREELRNCPRNSVPPATIFQVVGLNLLTSYLFDRNNHGDKYTTTHYYPRPDHCIAGQWFQLRPTQPLLPMEVFHRIQSNTIQAGCLS